MLETATDPKRWHELVIFIWPALGAGIVSYRVATDRSGQGAALIPPAGSTAPRQTGMSAATAPDAGDRDFFAFIALRNPDLGDKNVAIPQEQPLSLSARFQKPHQFIIGYWQSAQYQRGELKQERLWEFHWEYFLG